MAGDVIAFEPRRWSEAFRGSFVAMQSDPAVMADLGGPFDQTASNEKFDRYRDAWEIDGISRWAIVDQKGALLGYAGVMKRVDLDHPLGSHYEIGWRLCRDAWGRGLATESARQSLAHARTALGAIEIVSYTAADNLRSQPVMERLGFKRDATRDFTTRHPKGDWTGLVWVADRPRAVITNP